MMSIGQLSLLQCLQLVESERAVASHDRYNLATFMVLFLFITVEVMLVKVATAEYDADDENLHDPTAAATFFDANER